MTLKTENIKFLTSPPQVVLQDIKTSFKGANWDAKTIEIHLPYYGIPKCHHTSAYTDAAGLFSEPEMF